MHEVIPLSLFIALVVVVTWLGLILYSKPKIKISKKTPKTFYFYSKFYCKTSFYMFVDFLNWIIKKVNESI